MELKRYIRINPGIVVDLFNKDISSYDIKSGEDYDEDFLEVYYYNENFGEFSEYDNKGGKSSNQYLISNIIKTSDNLLDLCDEIIRVVEHTKEHNFITNGSWEQKDLTDRIKKSTDKIYGAIWTSKGLLYVAELINEGWKTL